MKYLLDTNVCVDYLNGRYPRVTRQIQESSPNDLCVSSVAVAEPLILAIDEPATQGFIEIRDSSSGNRVVTVIEVLSLTNKAAGAGQENEP